MPDHRTIYCNECMLSRSALQACSSFARLSLEVWYCGRSCGLSGFPRCYGNCGNKNQYWSIIIIIIVIIIVHEFHGNRSLKQNFRAAVTVIPNSRYHNRATLVKWLNHVTLCYQYRSGDQHPNTLPFECPPLPRPVVSVINPAVGRRHFHQLCSCHHRCNTLHQYKTVPLDNRGT